MPANRLDSHFLRLRWPFFLLLLYSNFALSFRVDGGDETNSASSAPPQFLSADDAGVQPTQIWLDERERLNLKCPLKTNATYIQWIKDGQQLQDETAMFLDMPAVSRIDSGVYRCYAENDFGALYSWPINVTVLYLDGFQTDALSVVTVPELGNFVLKPPPLKSSPGVQLSWRWFYQDSEITSDQQYYITLNGQLVVGSPQSIRGNYTVQVRASNGPSFYHHFLIETDGNQRRVADFKMLLVPEDKVYIRGRASPFSLRSGDRTVPTGTPTFECVPSSVSKNPATIRWFLNNEQLVSGGTDGVRIEQRGRRLILGAAHNHFLPDVHTATISCRASNAVDEVLVTAQLSMIVVPKIDRRFIDGERSVPIGSALRLKCKTTESWPRSKISWYFNGKRIPNTMSSDVLKIDNVEEQNYGVYQCEAINLGGSDTASVWVKQTNRVEKDEELFSPLADSSSTFHLVEHFTDKTLKMGAEIHLNCLTSDPANTQLTWRHNNMEVKVDDKHKMNRTALTIKEAEVKDSGRYECLATNLETEETVKVSADIQVRGSNLIEYGPSNQSVLIGTNIKMPCKIADDVLIRNGNLKPEWSRNGQRIAPEGDLPRRLSIDPDGSLSITQVGPDSIGTYKCLVKLGEEMEAVEASLQIIERPAMPQNVEAFVNTTMNPARIRVSWQPGFDGNSPLINHLVEMRTLAGANNELVSEWITVVKDIPPELCCSVLIDNLKPSASAEFRVIAVNRFGQGRPSAPSPNITMPQQPPAAAPRDVKGSGRSSSSLVVQWQPPPADQWNGDILGYTVRYRLAGYPTLPWMEKNISLTAHSGSPGISSAKNVLIDQLISWRDYEIQVAAFNDLGAGVYSKSIEVAPLESTPMQAPQNVEVEVLNSTDIRVSFDPLDQQMIPGVNLGYKIELWKGAAGSQLYKLVRVFPDYSRLSQQIGSLEKWGKYNLTVLCFTAPGDGPRSEALEFQTEEDVPGPVGSINFDQVLYSSVLIQWDAPAEKNGHIIKYILRHWETSQPMDKSVIEVNGHETNATIEGLRASTQYSVDLQALTQVGAGPRVEAKFESGIPPELPGRASSVLVSDIGARSAVLQFIPGFDGHSYIKNWIVEAKIGTSNVFSTLFTVSAPKARSLTVERLRPNTRYQLRLIAENVRGKGPPSEPTRIFETRQTEPERSVEKLYAEPLSHERIQVVWSPLTQHDWNGDSVGYLIHYRPVVAKRLGGKSNEMDELEDVKEQRDWKEIRTSSPKASELTLIGLEPYTTYQIKIYAENTVGRSEPSDLVSATTYESAPAEGPPNVQVQLEQQSLRVQWDDLPARSKHGQILGFRVKCEPEEDSLKKRFSQIADLVGADVRMAHFSNLRPFTDYRCTVYARTIVGESPPSSNPPLIRTAESRPTAPTNVRFGRISDTSVSLVWQQPNQPNGKITAYEIRYKRFDEPDTSEITTAVRQNLNEFSANSLTPNKTYIFSIRAETQAGWGPDATAAVFTSSQRANNLPSPTAPTSNPRHAPSARSIFLHWSTNREHKEPLTSRIAPIRAVEVEYQRANDAGWTMLDYSIGANTNEVQLDGLIPNQPYRARIRYITDFDRTAWSPESEWIKTLEVEPENAPQGLEAKPYESSSILLEWQALDPLKWNSDRIGYRVLCRIYQSNYSFLVDELPMSDQKPENGKIQHVIKKLASFHHYIVQVQAYNSLGSSVASTPPAFVYVGYSIPKQEVHGLEVTNATSTTIHLKWNDWQASEDDVISGYRIKYTPLLSSLSEEFKNEDGGESLEETVVTEKNEFTLVDLRKFTEYQISVCGYNRAGDGHAALIRAWTLEDVPGPVGTLHFSDILLDSVNVSWPEPAQPNGKIIGYSVTYRTYRQPDERRKEIQEKTSTNWLLASRLDEQTTYSFSVQALTSAGLGAEVASNVTIGFNDGAPEAPTKPVILPEESTFMMKWQNGLPGQSQIKGHLIQAKRVGVVTEKNQTLLIDDDEMNETDQMNDKMMDTGSSVETISKKPSKLITSRRLRRHLSSAYADAYSPRHPIGEWITLTHLLGGHQTEYRVSYRQLEPASFYVFRVYARNDLGVGKPSLESDRLQVPATLPDDPFYTKWWFLVIIGLLILMVIIVFVATLCVTSANAWKREHEKQKKQGAYDTHQLPDDFVVSYELQSKRDRADDQSTTPRPGTHTSWLSNEGLANGRLNMRSGDVDPAYGSIGSGLNGGINTGRSIYGSSSVYQALATDQLPIDGSARPKQNGAALGGYASRRQIQANGNQSRPTTNYWTQKNDDGDYITYGQRSQHQNQQFSDFVDPEDQVDAAEQAERSFASHYQASNPLQEDAAYRTWRRNRQEQADRERSRTPSRHAASNFGGYAAMGLQVGQPISRPESVSTSDSPGNGSEIGAAGSASTQSAKSVNLAQTGGIQLRNSDEFDSPKHAPYASVAHGYSSFV